MPYITGAASKSLSDTRLTSRRPAASRRSVGGGGKKSGFPNRFEALPENIMICYLLLQPWVLAPFGPVCAFPGVREGGILIWDAAVSVIDSVDSKRLGKTARPAGIAPR